jgi:hypothetical protein
VLGGEGHHGDDHTGDVEGIGTVADVQRGGVPDRDDTVVGDDAGVSQGVTDGVHVLVEVVEHAHLHRLATTGCERGRGR